MLQCSLLFVALFMLGCVSLTHCGAHNISHNGMLETFFGWTTMMMITVQVFDKDRNEDHDDDDHSAGL